MPFKKGDVKTSEWGKMGARKPYALEQEQLLKMQKIVSKDLDLLERVYDGTATENDLKILPLVKERVNKYLDKLHASKEAQEITGSLIINIEQEGATKYANRNTENSITR